MSVESNKAVVQRFSDAVWRNHQMDAIDDLFVADYQDPEIPAPAIPKLKAFFTGYFANRPDFQIVNEQLTAEDDRVVQYIQGAFTNTEERLGPIGKAMRMDEINIFTLKDGKIVGRFGVGRSR